MTYFIPSFSVFTVDLWCFAAWTKVAPDLSFVLRSNWCLFIYRRGDPDQERVQDGTGVQDGTQCRMAQQLYGGGRGSAGLHGVQDGTLCVSSTNSNFQLTEDLSPWQLNYSTYFMVHNACEVTDSIFYLYNYPNTLHRNKKVFCSSVC